MLKIIGCTVGNECVGTARRQLYLVRTLQVFFCKNRKNYHYDEDGTIFFLAYMILFNVIIIVVNEECKIVYPSANEKHTEYILDLVKKGGHEYQIIRLMHLTNVNHYDLLQCNRGIGNLNNFDLHKCLV